MSGRQQIVIVGSGIAGLTAALELGRLHDVTLVTKSELAESNTRWAQGGIAAAMFPDDSVAEHIADTLRAGAGLCRREAVEVLCGEGPERIRELIRIGVAFDQHNGELARGLEAAHSRPRVLHAKGDATGLSIEMALVHAVRASGVRVLEHTFAADLVLTNGRISGLEILHSGGMGATLFADAVIIASGGAGQLYRHTTNPAGATGDGIAMALRAGALLADLEFYQFHPTALATADTFLISEAVRGEGATLLDSEGRRFMLAIDPAGELAPRDVVARGIARQMALQGGEPVQLDARHLEAQHGTGFLARRFPSIDAASRRRGFDWTQQTLPVTPAAHYWMGGIRTDLWGRTSVRGLYAIGEAACTGAHGANRLASNSLLESLVFAGRCAKLLAAGDDTVALTPADGNAASSGSLPDQMLPPRSPRMSDATEPLILTQDLQTLLWSAVGIERSRVSLEAAVDQLFRWQVDDRRFHGSHVAALEARNLLELAQATAQSALARYESRGAHFRTDYPETLSGWRHSLTVRAAGTNSAVVLPQADLNEVTTQ